MNPRGARARSGLAARLAADRRPRARSAAQEAGAGALAERWGLERDSGATDLAGAFLGCGSAAVVASPYDLDLAVACRLSRHFHEALARGADAAGALRQARAELARDPELAASAQPFPMRGIGFAPAPFAPFGAAASEDHGSRMALWVSCALAAALVASWALRRRIPATRRAA